MAATPLVVKMLGGPKLFGGRVSSEFKLIQKVRTGLPYFSLESVMKALDISREEASASLAVPLRTLARRKRERKLHADESDRLFRFARIAAQAVEVLGGGEAASRWLRGSNRALGGVTPLSLLDTEPGVRQVEELLGRIEFGMFS